MLTVGSKCFYFLVSLLMCGLIRVHTFTKTVYTLLDAIKMALKFGMDMCLQSIFRMYHTDIFDQHCDGKLELKARSHNKNSFSLSICAVIGQIINKQINIETISMFIYGLIAESIRDLMPEIAFSWNSRQQPEQQQSNCFLISNDPVILARSIAAKMATVTNIRANAHMLIEFGLELLQVTLKCGKPLVPMFNDSISGCSNVRVTTLTLKCISIVIGRQMSLERLDAAISIFGNIFFLPMQSILRTIANILWINHKKHS